MTAPVPGPFGPFRYDVTSRSWRWSDPLFGIFGFQPGEVVPTTELLLAHKHPEDAAVARAAIETALTSGRPFSLWHRIIDTRGRVRRVVSVGDAVRDGDGRLVEVHGYLVDVTEQLRVETGREVDEAVRRSAESRATIEQAKGALMAVGGISADQAFELLRRGSQHHNVKLRCLAGDLVAAVEACGGVLEEVRTAAARTLEPVDRPDTGGARAR